MSFASCIRFAPCSLTFAFALAGSPDAQVGHVQSWSKYSQQVLDAFDSFGASLAALGDLDGDGIGDLAVGAPGDADGGLRSGAVWILFPNADGTIRSHRKISEISGWLEADLDFDNFGSGLAGLGDLDRDGTPDLAVGALRTKIGQTEGAVWILFLKRDGSVRSWQRLRPLGLPASAQLGQDWIGDAVACVGDVDGDRVVDLALGQMRAGPNEGAVWILFLRSDGTLKGEHRIGELDPGFTGDLHASDLFGSSVAPLGDLNRDGVPDLAVGAFGDDDGGLNHGAVWIVFLAPNGGVRGVREISAARGGGGFGGHLDLDDGFGKSVCAAGDLDGDGIVDLAVGAYHDDDGGTDKGAFWILNLNADGTVKEWQKISETEGGFGGSLESDPHYSSANFGAALAFLGDLDGDGTGDIGVGTPGHGTPVESGTDRGALWILEMSGVKVAAEHQFLGATRGWGSGRFVKGKFGSSAAVLDDLDGNGARDLAVGAPLGGSALAGSTYDTGALWILFLDADGGVLATRHFGAFPMDGFQGPLDHLDAFGCALASLGDLDGDGIGDVAVGAEGDDDGGTDTGAVWILFLAADGSIKAEQKISEIQGGFGEGLSPLDAFGCALAARGDTDGDGRVELLVGAKRDDDGGQDFGAGWILSLNADGTVAARSKISAMAGGFAGALTSRDRFGSSVADIGDLDGDGLRELAVGAEGDTASQGNVWILFLAADGTVASEVRIGAGSGGFVGPLSNFDHFGRSVAGLGDIDGDDVPDLAVGAYLLEDDPSLLARDQGAAWILLMNADGSVRLEVKIAEHLGGFGGQLSREVQFGASVTAADVNGDGVRDLLVGAAQDGDLGPQCGAVWALSLDAVAIPGLDRDGPASTSRGRSRAPSRPPRR